METRGELSPKKFSGNERVQIQNDFFGQIAVKKTRESISGNDN